jgi:hypothetical protein
MHLERARNSAARFDLDLRIGDRSGDAAGGANQQPFARNENAIEGAPHIGILGRRLTPENATLLDEDVLAIV